MRESRHFNRPPDALHSVSEVARRLSVSEKTVRRWIERRDLVSHRLGSSIRISEADLQVFLAQRRGL